MESVELKDSCPKEERSNKQNKTEACGRRDLYCPTPAARLGDGY